MIAPSLVQLIGAEVAIAWSDGRETYFTGEELRAASPSAANLGERDILGNQYGGDGPEEVLRRDRRLLGADRQLRLAV